MGNPPESRQENNHRWTQRGRAARKKRVDHGFHGWARVSWDELCLASVRMDSATLLKNTTNRVFVFSSVSVRAHAWLKNLRKAISKLRSDRGTDVPVNRPIWRNTFHPGGMIDGSRRSQRGAETAGDHPIKILRTLKGCQTWPQFEPSFIVLDAFEFVCCWHALRGAVPLFALTGGLRSALRPPAYSYPRVIHRSEETVRMSSPQLL